MPLLARLTGTDDEMTRRLLCGFGSDLDVYSVRAVEKDFTVLSART